MRILSILVLTAALGLGCSGGIGDSGKDGGIDPDGGGGPGDLGEQGGVDLGGPDLSYSGPPGLELVAGSIGGLGSLDGTGAQARLGVAAVTSDGAGTLYIADQSGSGRLRMMVAATGAVSTIATTMPLQLPADLVRDAAGNLYVSVNSFGSAILKVAAGTGAVTTVAGGSLSGYADGTGAAAQFKGASGLALDGAGNLYVAETQNHTIRKVVVATGQVTTLAGTATMSGSTDAMGMAARFNGPQGLALDGAGNLYIADNQNATIRKLVLGTGQVTTVAGSAGLRGATDATGGAARFYAPVRLAVVGGSLFIVDSTVGTIRQLDLASGAVTTLAGVFSSNALVDGAGTAARFKSPLCITADGAGTLYVGDSYTLRKIVIATAAVTTVAGLAEHPGNLNGIGPAASFRQPAGMAVDGAGNVYVADTMNGLIRKVVVTTGAVTTLAGGGVGTGSIDGIGTAARFNLPTGVAWDGGGNLYVADTYNQQIRKIALATAQVTTIAGTAGVSGNTDGIGSAARFNFPNGLAADTDGTVYVADTNNRLIRKVIAATGVVTTFAGSSGAGGSTDGIGTTARFLSPVDIATDRAGNLYVSDSFSVRKIVAATAAVSTLAGGVIFGSTDGVGTAARFNVVHGLTYDGAGSLYIADYDYQGAARIRRLTLANLQVTSLVGSSQLGVRTGALPGSLNEPWGVAWVPGQGLAISDYTENAVLIAHGL